MTVHVQIERRRYQCYICKDVINDSRIMSALYLLISALLAYIWLINDSRLQTSLQRYKQVECRHDPTIKDVCNRLSLISRVQTWSDYLQVECRHDPTIFYICVNIAQTSSMLYMQIERRRYQYIRLSSTSAQIWRRRCIRKYNVGACICYAHVAHEWYNSCIKYSAWRRSKYRLWRYICVYNAPVANTGADVIFAYTTSTHTLHMSDITHV